MIDNKKVIRLASFKKRFWVRFLDIVISSIPLLIMSLTYKYWHLSQIKSSIIMICVAFILLIFYFIALPLMMNGQTLMKKVFKIKFFNKSNNNVLPLITREVFIIFIPWIAILITNFVISVILKKPFGSAFNKNNLWSTNILKISTLFYLVWYLGLSLAIKFDKKGQFFIDVFYNTYIVDLKIYKEKSKKIEPHLIEKNDMHSHLKNNLPGLIGEKEIKDAIGKSESKPKKSNT